MVTKLLTRTAFFLAVLSALLFGGAGTLDWPIAWLFLVQMAALGLALGLWLARHDPGLLRERLAPRFQRDQKSWDRVIMAAMMAAMLSWYLLIGLDAGRWQLWPVPTPLRLLGEVGILLCMYVTYRVMRENSFAAPVVKVQVERAHRVVDTGPYSYVRHPMYAGVLLYLAGAPLLLGSWLGLAAVPLMLPLLALRIVLEERTLAAELPGYAQYATRVRWRLLPGVW